MIVGHNFKEGDVIVRLARPEDVGTIIKLYDSADGPWASIVYDNTIEAFPLKYLQLHHVTKNQKLLKEAMGIKEC